MTKDKKEQYYPGIDLLKAFGLYLMILGHGALVQISLSGYRPFRCYGTAD